MTFFVASYSLTQGQANVCDLKKTKSFIQKKYIYFFTSKQKCVGIKPLSVIAVLFCSKIWSVMFMRV